MSRINSTAEKYYKRSISRVSRFQAHTSAVSFSLLLRYPPSYNCQAWGYLTKTSCQDHEIERRRKSMFIHLLNFNTNTCHGCLCRPSRLNLVHLKSRKVKKKQAIAICLPDVMQTIIGLNEFFWHFSDGLEIKLHLSQSLRRIFSEPLRSSVVRYKVIHLPVNLTSIYLVLHYTSYVSFNTHVPC